MASQNVSMDGKYMYSEKTGDTQADVSVYFAITKTYLYNFDPLKPHFYIVKLGFSGVYVIFSYFCSKT